ncbi:MULTISPECIES: AEC family transporter [unclassified Paenibacillus]|uniref:AEC family transporter n=1 Tax=unclassified Paenibacillus TaxID=185978 RepID=UPI002406E3B9|nr:MULTISPECIES: AEC family transporter [unclassified Paenibacillus]MDF9844771.1 putative permease [Paenibacillus sp. PastF-2]MDF9851373.1 putative permease [Paenibacillus sp. PastM-2]MDF9857955.1 putative permease [Paenibacillus sp. PastF-1]MDH6483223.1 putative permease [Paenibacillus sp. PastH-2]MDH6510633.1 putative permease [Paenibacillus sp. PastM-3]
MSAIFSQIFLLFGLMMIGYIVNKVKVMDEVAEKKISKLIVNVTIPATILYSSMSQGVEDKTRILWVIVVAVAVFLITPMLSSMAVRTFKMDKTFKLMLNYSNLGFMGIPIVSSIYGGNAVFDVSIFMMVFNISLFSHGISILQEGHGTKTEALKNMLNPGILSAVIALGIFLLDIPVPLPLASLCSSVGSITTPLAMIVIGSTMASISIKEVIQDKEIYLYTIMKIILIPAVIWFILQFFVQDPMILGIAVILSSLPTAGNVSMLCSEYNGNIGLVTKGIFMSTLCSIVTIPILLIIF